MKKYIRMISIILLMLLLAGCSTGKNEWKKENLKKSVYTKEDIPGYVTAKVVTENISEKNSTIDIELTTSGQKEISSHDSFMSAEVFLDGEWYQVPKISEEYMFELPTTFGEGETSPAYADLRTFEMKSGKYRVLVPYLTTENLQKQYYAPAEFIYEE